MAMRIDVLLSSRCLALCPSRSGASRTGRYHSPGGGHIASVASGCNQSNKELREADEVQHRAAEIAHNAE